MKQLSQTDSSETHISVNESPAVSGALLPGQEADGAELSEPCDPSNQNTEPEYLLKLVASLESCNTALFNKLNQAERELATLKKSIVQALPKTEPTGNQKQSFCWERKLTRTQWKPT